MIEISFFTNLFSIIKEKYDIDTYNGVLQYLYQKILLPFLLVD